MTNHPVSLGSTDVSLTAKVNDTVTVTNAGTQKINVVTAVGLDPQGSNKLDHNESKTYTVEEFPTGNDPKIIFTWNEVGALAPRKGTIDPG